MNKNYIALITHDGTETSPTVNVIQNTLGQIEWTRIESGLYDGIGAGLFPEDSTFIELKYQSANMITPVSNAWGWHRNSDDQISIQTDDMDGQLLNHLLIITVYERTINYTI